MVNVVLVRFEFAVVSAKVTTRHDGQTISEFFYAAGIGRLDLDEVAVRESAALGQPVTLEHITAEILREAADRVAEVLS